MRRDGSLLNEFKETAQVAFRNRKTVRQAWPIVAQIHKP